MTDPDPKHKLLVLTTRLKVASVVETLTEQSPEVEEAIGKTEEKLKRELADLDDGWRVQSHSVSFYSGLIVTTFLLVRD